MTPIEQKMAGTWRSFKLYCFSGKVEIHNTSQYIELSLDENSCLTLFQAQAKRHAISLQDREWKIEEIKKRRYLYFGKKQAYELITIESDNLVLADLVKGEKIFFAKMPKWNRRIEPVVTSIRHINASHEKEEK